MCKKSMNGKFKYIYVQNNRTTHGELHFGEATKTKHNKRYIYFHVWGKRKGSVLRGSFRATWSYFAPRYLQASPLYVTVKTLVLFVYVQFIKKWSFLFKVNRLLKEKKNLNKWHCRGKPLLILRSNVTIKYSCMENVFNCRRSAQCKTPLGRPSEFVHFYSLGNELQGRCRRHLLQVSHFYHLQLYSDGTNVLFL